MDGCLNVHITFLLRDLTLEKQLLLLVFCKNKYKLIQEWLQGLMNQHTKATVLPVTYTIFSLLATSQIYFK